METLDFASLVDSGRLAGCDTAFTIGVFDGVHRGHRRILETVVRTARERKGCVSLVISFRTNPKPSSAGELDTIRLRTEYVASFGVDFFALIDFSADFSKIGASGFVDLLMRASNPIAAVVGSDFRFGNPSSQASGRDLPRLVAEKGGSCNLIEVDAVMDDEGRKISSTSLRQLVIQGELEGFLHLSGQFYRVDLVPLPYRPCSGELIFSRASIHQLLPPLGSYDTRLLLSDGRMVESSLRIGRESLVLSSPFLSSAIGSVEGRGKGTLQLDSLFLEKRR